MTPQEKDLIAQLIGRLPSGNEPKDAEADALIRDGVRQKPDAPYFLVQTVLIQEMALAQAQSRIQELERQLATAQAPQQQQPTSFLGRALHGTAPSPGPWGPAAAPAPSSSNSVWTQSGGAPTVPPIQAGSPTPWGGGGSGFLRQAAMTAAGVAGGALLFQGIQSMFGPHYGNLLSGMPTQPGLSETVINNYYGDQGTPAPDTRQADFQQADDTDQDDASGQDFADNQDFGGDGGNFDV
jgi:hypothetical protein